LSVSKDIKPGDVLLELNEIQMSFGKICALNGVSAKIKKGEIHSVIGPNGAGKTVMMNCISGLYHPQKGVFITRKKINTKPHERAKLGIQEPFRRWRFSGNDPRQYPPWAPYSLQISILAAPSIWEKQQAKKLNTENLSDNRLLEIEHIRHKPVGMLPYGLQKRVELGRAIALEPELLLLDEPLAGLNLEEVEDMARFILDVNQEARWKVTCILVEHDMGVVMDLSDNVFVLNFGNMIVDGSPEEVQGNPQVVKAYLGEEDLYATRR
jgi:branched-chain amino acid transport system ATP-binding protein